MNRVPLVVLGFGAFLLVLALSLPTFVYGRAMLHPLDPWTTTHLEADAATVFDTALLRERRDLALVLTSSVRGDGPAGNADRAVWTEFATLNTFGGDRLDYWQRRVAFDRRSGLTVDCCRSYLTTSKSAVQGGLAFRWPVDAARREYPLFDPVTKQVQPARFEGDDQVLGLAVHRYAQRIMDAPTGETVELPRSAVGLRGPGLVRLDRYATLARTLWVEPVSGIPVRVEEIRRDVFRAPDGGRQLVALAADLRTRDDDVRTLVTTATAAVTFSDLLRGVLPTAFATGGVVLVLLGLYGARRRTAPARDSAPARDPEPARDSELAHDEQEVPADDLPEPGDRDDAGRPAGMVAGKGVDHPDE